MPPLNCVVLAMAFCPQTKSGSSDVEI
uniref:Uncharacterized protein n=1 Tax=Anguilla anguilla TaxID=7936 RepID=A0A0E9SR03_ANGAN